VPRLPLRDKLWKLVYLAYYPLLFGRRFPGAARLAAGIRGFEERTGRGDAPLSRAAWEEQYREGAWDHLHGQDERARYDALVEILQARKSGGAVLDVGCGDGLLRDRLRPLGYSRFVGVDLSAAAIGRAAAVEDERAEFLAADAESFAPAGGARFDAIVFNECVYYFTRPVETVARYRQFLAPGGIFLISMFRSLRTAAIARELKTLFPAQDEVLVAHGDGVWEISVHAPDAAGAAPDPRPPAA
jgi:SAM-dependent methyltransferase